MAKKPPKTCSEPECSDVVLGRGLCRRHYLRRWRKAEFPARARPEGSHLLMVTVSFTKEQLRKMNRLLAHRSQKRSVLYREMVDDYFSRLSPEEKEAIEKPMGPVKVEANGDD